MHVHPRRFGTIQFTEPFQQDEAKQIIRTYPIETIDYTNLGMFGQDCWIYRPTRLRKTGR
jgi:hypothetical protein